MIRLVTRYLTHGMLLLGISLPAFAHSRIAQPTPDEQRLLAELNETTPSKELLKHIASNSYYLGVRSAELLAQRKEKDAVPDLMSILSASPREENRYARYSALVALSKLEDSRAVEIILQHGVEVVQAFLDSLIPSPQDEKTVREVKQSFSRLVTRDIPEEKRAEVLVAKLDTMGDWVLGALMEMGGKATAPLLAKLQDTTATPALRIQVLRCLRELRSPEAAPVLQKILSLPKEDPFVADSGRLLAEAASALIAIVGSDGLGTVKQSFARNTDWLTRLYIAQSLGELKDVGTKDWLKDLAEKPELTADTTATRRQEDRAKAVRDHAALSAAKIDVNLAQDRTAAVLKHLQDPHPWVRTFAMQTLVGVQDRRILQPAAQALSDKEDNVRRFAIEALGMSGDRAAIEPLKSVLAGGEVTDHFAAKAALESLGLSVVWAEDKFHVVDPAEDILAKLRSPSAEDRRQALNTALKRGSEAGILLAAALSSTDENTRRGAEEATDLLAKRVLSGAESEASQANLVLGRMGPYGAPALLETIRKVEASGLRRKIAEALAKNGAQVVPAIASALNLETRKDQPWIADMFHALALCGAPGEHVLRQFADGPDETYRALAKKALEQTAAPR